MTRFRHLLVALIATLVCAGQLQAQTGTIRGRILDATIGGGVSGATVTVADRTVESDTEGRFVVTGVPAGTYTLRATRIGYQDVERSITVVSGQTSTLDINMVPAPVGIEELVAIGYGETQKRDLTGVVDVVPTEEFNTGRVVSAGELIQGKVAGVEVVQNDGGEPGGEVSLRIRGGTSVTASNEPLYVIDGVPLPVGGGLRAADWGQGGRNPMNFLNPEDIESFTVLKDASATAIYGSQGANGVILITTKSGRGTTGATRVSYRGNFSGSNVIKRPDILSAAEFRSVVQDRYESVVPVLGDANTDWRKAIEQSAFGQEHTVSVTGAGEKLNYRLSLGYLNQEGVLQKSKNERVSLSASYNQLLFNDRLRLAANVLGARNDDEFTPGGALGSANNFAPTQPVLDSLSVYGGYFEWAEPRGVNNPVGIVNQNIDEGTTYRSIGNLTTDYAFPFLDGLSATARVGYVATSAERRGFNPSTDKNQAENGLNGTVTRANPTEFTSLFDGFANYARGWEQHALDLTGGYSFQRWRYEWPSFYAQKLSSDFLGISGVPAAQLERTSLWVTESRLASWFARANYTFRDRYLFTVSLRRDGSSKFGKDNQWGSFPSFAVAWRMSQEPFMSGSELFSDLKLRFSWGKNGNQAFEPYMQYKAYTFGDPLVQVQFGDEFVPTIRPAAVDPNIKWEETSSWNIGVDYGLWDNRVSGSLEYYNKETKDLIFPIIVAGGSNLSNVVTTNVGKMSNKGFEVTVNALIARGEGDGFSWDANFNIAYNKNELLELNPFRRESPDVEQIMTGQFISGGVGSSILVLRPGQPVNSFLVYRTKVDTLTGEVIGRWPRCDDVEVGGNGDGVCDDLEMYMDQPNVPVVVDSVQSGGSWVYIYEYRRDGVINQDDRVPYKSADSPWILGHTSTMRWRKFDLSFSLLAKFGGYVYNNIASSTGWYGQIVVNDNAPNNVHRSVLENNFEGPQYFSDVYVESASFLRMQNIQLGYSLSPRLRIYGVVQNAFTITGYSGIDPTAGIEGIDNNIYPSTRTFTAGLNVAF